MIMAADKALIAVDPEELRFQFELEKQSYCDLKVTNRTEHHVAFKVKTTSPKKYFVRPNTGVIHPWDSCIIRVTLQAQREYPPYMQCKDKFLLQSTIFTPKGDVDDIPADTFTKDSGRVLDECKLRVVYVSPDSEKGSAEDESLNSTKGSLENVQGNTSTDDNRVLQQLNEERDAVILQTKQLQQELETLKRLRNGKSKSGFSLKLALLVGFIGIMFGFLLKLKFSSTTTTV